MHTEAIELIFYLARSTLLFTAYKSDLRHLRWPKGRTDTERGGQTLRRGTDTKGRVYTEVSSRYKGLVLNHWVPGAGHPIFFPFFIQAKLGFPNAPVCSVNDHPGVINHLLINQL